LLLSLVLFILFITPLYTRLDEVEEIISVGFVDDTNIITVVHDTKTAYKRLE